MVFLPIPLEVDLDCASSFAFLGVTKLLFLLLRQVHNIYLQSYAVFCIEHHVTMVAFQLFFQGILYRQSTAFGTNKPQVLSIHIPLKYSIYRVYNDISHRVLVTVSWCWWQIDVHARRDLVIFVTNIGPRRWELTGEYKDFSCNCDIFEMLQSFCLLKFLIEPIPLLQTASMMKDLTFWMILTLRKQAFGECKMQQLWFVSVLSVVPTILGFSDWVRIGWISVWYRETGDKSNYYNKWNHCSFLGHSFGIHSTWKMRYPAWECSGTPKPSIYHLLGSSIPSPEQRFYKSGLLQDQWIQNWNWNWPTSQNLLSAQSSKP